MTNPGPEPQAGVVLLIGDRRIPCDMLRDEDADQDGDTAWLAVPREHVTLPPGGVSDLQLLIAELPPRTLIVLDIQIGRAAFTDPASGAACNLVIPDGGAIWPGPGQPKIGIAHPGCETLGDLALDLDAWQCRACGVIGRVSGAWCADMIGGRRP